jgi:hypothetical protein
MDMPEVRARARRAVLDAVAELGVEWSEQADSFVVVLPGTRKLRTECVLAVGDRDLFVRAFVARHPDENHEGVYRWLLQRNLRLPYVAFGLDALGDIHLIGRLSLDHVTPALIDQVLGVVADAADTSFNTIVELGFAESIRREWVWRRSRGESTANLAAFDHLDPGRPSDAARQPDARGTAVPGACGTAEPGATETDRP